jgi:hypothetical protein
MHCNIVAEKEPDYQPLYPSHHVPVRGRVAGWLGGVTRYREGGLQNMRDYLA